MHTATTSKPRGNQSFTQLLPKNMTQHVLSWFSYQQWQPLAICSVLSLIVLALLSGNPFWLSQPTKLFGIIMFSHNFINLLLSSVDLSWPNLATDHSLFKVPTITQLLMRLFSWAVISLAVIFTLPQNLFCYAIAMALESSIMAHIYQTPKARSHQSSLELLLFLLSTTLLLTVIPSAWLPMMTNARFLLICLVWHWGGITVRFGLVQSKYYTDDLLRIFTNIAIFAPCAFAINYMAPTLLQAWSTHPLGIVIIACTLVLTPNEEISIDNSMLFINNALLLIASTLYMYVSNIYFSGLLMVFILRQMYKIFDYHIDKDVGYINSFAGIAAFFVAILGLAILFVPCHLTSPLLMGSYLCRFICIGILQHFVRMLCLLDSLGSKKLPTISSLLTAMVCSVVAQVALILIMNVHPGTAIVWSHSFFALINYILLAEMIANTLQWRSPFTQFKSYRYGLMILMGLIISISFIFSSNFALPLTSLLHWSLGIKPTVSLMLCATLFYQDFLKQGLLGEEKPENLSTALFINLCACPFLPLNIFSLVYIITSHFILNKFLSPALQNVIHKLIQHPYFPLATLITSVSLTGHLSMLTHWLLPYSTAITLIDMPIIGFLVSAQLCLMTKPNSALQTFKRLFFASFAATLACLLAPGTCLFLAKHLQLTLITLTLMVMSSDHAVLKRFIGNYVQRLEQNPLNTLGQLFCLVCLCQPTLIFANIATLTPINLSNNMLALLITSMGVAMVFSYLYYTANTHQTPNLKSFAKLMTGLLALALVVTYLPNSVNGFISTHLWLLILPSTLLMKASITNEKISVKSSMNSPHEACNQQPSSVLSYCCFSRVTTSGNKSNVFRP